MKYSIRFKGGAGSGNHGHKGIPGHQGGSLPKGESQGITEQQRTRAEYEQSRRNVDGYTRELRPESTATDEDFDKAYAALHKRDAQERKDFHAKYPGWSPVKDSSSSTMMQKIVGAPGNSGYARVQMYKSGGSWRLFGIRYVGDSGNTKGMGDTIRKGGITTMEEVGRLAEEYLKKGK